MKGESQVTKEIAEMYARKRRFVETLSEAYEIAGVVTKVIYHRDPERNIETVFIHYPGGVTKIDVTGNSHQVIGREIANQISGINAVGLIR